MAPWAEELLPVLQVVDWRMVPVMEFVEVCCSWYGFGCDWVLCPVMVVTVELVLGRADESLVVQVADSHC